MIRVVTTVARSFPALSAPLALQPKVRRPLEVFLVSTFYRACPGSALALLRRARFVQRERQIDAQVAAVDLEERMAPMLPLGCLA